MFYYGIEFYTVEFGGIQYHRKKLDQNWHKLLGKHYFIILMKIRTDGYNLEFDAQTFY